MHANRSVESLFSKRLGTQSQNKVVERARIFLFKYHFSLATFLEIGTKAFLEVGTFGT